MTEQEKREWLEWEANTNFNLQEPYSDTEAPTQNIAFMKYKGSPKLYDYLIEHDGKFIYRGADWYFSLPNGLTYKIVTPTNNCARSYKPYRAIIDSNIDYNFLWQVVIPCCNAVCHKMEII